MKGRSKYKHMKKKKPNLLEMGLLLKPRGKLLFIRVCCGVSHNTDWDLVYTVSRSLTNLKPHRHVSYLIVWNSSRIFILFYLLFYLYKKKN